PGVAQLAQLQEHGLRVRGRADARIRFAQAGDDGRALQAEEDVDLALFAQRGDVGIRGILVAAALQHRRRLRVVGLAIQREAQVVHEVVVPGIEPCLVREPRQLVRERRVELLRVPAVVAVPGPGIEQRVAAEERRRVRARQQADVAHRVAGRVEAFELHAAGDAAHVGVAYAARHRGNAGAGILVRDHGRAGGLDHALVAAGMVAMLVGIEDLRDRPAALARDGEAAAEIQRVDRERFAGFPARHQVVEIPQGVAGPDLFDDHGCLDGTGARRGGVRRGRVAPGAGARNAPFRFGGVIGATILVTSGRDSMRTVVAVVLSSLVLAACGEPSTPPSAQSGGDTAKGEEMSRIFDMPYLMRDLENGLRVIVVRTDYPDIVSMHIPVQTGSRNEVEPGKSGFAHFFEHMMFRGTEQYPPDVYGAILKQAGANQNAYTTDDYTNYHVTFTRDDLEKMIELEADRFQNLSYSEADFRTEALAVKGEYLKNYSDPTSKAYERIRDLAFDVHTYRHTTMGFIEDIEDMPNQLEYSRQFFGRWYRPEKTSVIIVGDVDPEATFELVKKYWGGWERGDYDVEIPVEPPLEGPVYEHIAWEGPTQPWIFIAFRGPAFDPNEKAMPAMDLIASIWFSERSDLYRKLVLEDQSVDQLVTYFPNRKDPNLLMIYARLTDEAHAPEVVAAIDRTLAEARTRFVDEKLVEDTKSRLRYLFTSQLDSSDNIAGVLAAFVQHARTPETINEVYRTYDKLTAEDLRR